MGTKSRSLICSLIALVLALGLQISSAAETNTKLDVVLGFDDDISSYVRDFENEEDDEAEPAGEQLKPLRALSPKEKNDLIKESYRAGIKAAPRSKSDRQEQKMAAKMKAMLGSSISSPEYLAWKGSKKQGPIYADQEDEGDDEDDDYREPNPYEDEDDDDDEDPDISQIEREIAQDPRVNIDAKDLLGVLLRDRYTAIKQKVEEMLRASNRPIFGPEAKPFAHDDDDEDEIVNMEPYSDFDVEAFDDEVEKDDNDEESDEATEDGYLKFVDPEDLEDEDEYEDEVDLRNFSAQYQKARKAGTKTITPKKEKKVQESGEKDGSPKDAEGEREAPKVAGDSARKLSATFNPNSQAADYLRRLEQGGLVTPAAVAAYEQDEEEDTRKQYRKFMSSKTTPTTPTPKTPAIEKLNQTSNSNLDSYKFLDKLLGALVQNELSAVLKEMSQESSAKRKPSPESTAQLGATNTNKRVHKIYGPSDISLYYKNLKESAEQMRQHQLVVVAPEEQRGEESKSSRPDFKIRKLAAPEAETTERSERSQPASGKDYYQRTKSRTPAKVQQKQHHSIDYLFQFD